MNYSEETVRRQDHLLDENDALEILKTGKYGVLSMQRTGGGGYGVPLIYVCDGDSVIYVHGAVAGRKLDYLHNNNIVSFCIVGESTVRPHHFTMAYKSIILDCKANLNVDDTEKMKVFEMILDKYCPDDKEEGLKYAHEKFDLVKVIRLEVTNMTGKDEIVKD